MGDGEGEAVAFGGEETELAFELVAAFYGGYVAALEGG